MKATRLFLAAALFLALPFIARADTITLRFGGTADLSAFGAPADSVFAGSVVWDTTSSPQAGDGSGWSRFLIDGAPDSVRATFAINGVDYINDLQPFSRLEFDGSSMFVDLWFDPLVDLDGGPAPDISRVTLDAWTDDVAPVLFDFNIPPANLAFLSHLEHRRFLFDSPADPPDFEVTSAESASLVVPEPSLLSFVALSVAIVSARVRTAGRTKSSARQHAELQRASTSAALPR